MVAGAIRVLVSSADVFAGQSLCSSVGWPWSARYHRPCGGGNFMNRGTARCNARAVVLPDSLLKFEDRHLPLSRLAVAWRGRQRCLRDSGTLGREGWIARVWVRELEETAQERHDKERSACG